MVLPASFCPPRPGIGAGLARALSKLGFCSRSQARILIGPLHLGELAKGQYRFLSQREREAF